jgi:hypothetical protein
MRSREIVRASQRVTKILPSLASLSAAMDLPSPRRALPERIQLWAEVLTGRCLDENDLIQELSFEQWLERRQRLIELGGTPVAWRQQ